MTKKIVPFGERQIVMLIGGPDGHNIQKVRVVEDLGGNHFVTCYNPISKTDRKYPRSALKVIR